MIDYPLKFEPILQEKIWGGTKLKNQLGKKTDSNCVGESWELSSVDNFISIIANGELKGKPITDIIKKFKGDLVGNKVYNDFGDKFPLLFKFIDAKENLSVQLHPNDELAKKRHNSFGKTEMWYVVDAEKNAELNVGFKKEISSDTYVKALEEKKILEYLNFEKVTKGDSYFIKEGLVHAIGAGCLIAEIQQTSDITYRIYDWNRVDNEGNERKLHTSLAVDAIDYKAPKQNKCSYTKNKNEANLLASCEYFTTNYIPVVGSLKKDCTNADSFFVYMCVSGSGKIKVNNTIETIKTGETVLIPAMVKEMIIESEQMELLEVYIK